MVRAGVIGCGYTGRLHAQGYLKAGATVTACFSRSPERARGLAEVYGAAWTDDYRELLRRDDVDVVSICTPTWTHQEIAMAALEAGKHVLCEKPVTATRAQCEPLVRKVQTSKLLFQAGYMKVHHPLTRDLAELLPEIAPLRVCHVRTFYPVPLDRWAQLSLTRERQGGGALMLSGSHVLAVVCLLLGYPVEAHVLSHWENATECADRYTATLFRQPEGAVAIFEAGWLALTNVGLEHTGWEEFIELNGDGGRLEIHYPWWNRTDQISPRLLLHSNKDGQTHEFHARPVSHFDAEVAAFVQSVQAGSTPVPSIEDAYRIHALIEQLYSPGERNPALRLSYTLPGGL
ncbi:MAG: Gfo/Idh/MocA family oxidoreductase [Chloroflexi bacterium]|nr:Gfo/Idh/MocA family oxidoreductase [Chloroflexota bacterium]